MLITILTAFSSTRKLNAKRFLRKPAIRLLYKFIVGTWDLHSTHRISAVKLAFRKGLKTVDVGAGDGTISVELALSNNTPIIALAHTDAQATSLAAFVDENRLSNYVRVSKDDAQKIESIEDGKIEQVLMIDVLEHVADEEKALKAVHRVLVKRGYFLISVPTPNYPYWFGFDMDRKIGHLRHYRFETLNAKLESHGFTTEKHFYYTSAKVSLLCNIWYSRIRRRTLLGVTLPIFLFSSLFFESLSDTLGANSSLLVLARKI